MRIESIVGGVLVLSLCAAPAATQSLESRVSDVEDRSERTALRERAIRVLGERDGGGYLMEVYPGVTDPALRERIIRTVAANGSRSDWTWLMEIALDSSERTNVRERSVRLLGESRATSEELVYIYDQLGSRRVKERLLRILGARGDDVAIDMIIDVANNERDRALRDRAFRILAASSSEEASLFIIRRAREVRR